MKKTIFLLLTITISAFAVSAQKLEVKDVVAKHLLSVVSPEQKTKVTNLTAVGETVYSQGTNHQREFKGKSVLVSDGQKMALAIAFPLQNYAFERVIFDGRKLTLPFIRPGERSVLGNFLWANDEIVKEGLLGGVLSTAWILNHPDAKRGSFSMQGSKKLDGRDVNILSYTTKGGTGLSVKMFFDAATGRHVRTEYRRKSTQSMAGSPEASASFTNDIIEEMSEDFSDFKTEAGVTLPTSYHIRVAQVHGTSTTEVTYSMTIGTFYYNQQLDAATFDAQANS